MRLTSSSSLILATLAISSSSPGLAAPADPVSLQQDSLSSSSSIRSVAMAGRDEHNVGVSHDMLPHHEVDYPAHDRRGLVETLDSAVAGLPVLGALLSPILEKLFGIEKIVQGKAISEITPEDRDALRQAFLDAASSVDNQPHSYRRSIVGRTMALWDVVESSSQGSTTSSSSTSSSSMRPGLAPSVSVPVAPPNSPASVAVSMAGNATSKVPTSKTSIIPASVAEGASQLTTMVPLPSGVPVNGSAPSPPNVAGSVSPQAAAGIGGALPSPPPGAPVSVPTVPSVVPPAPFRVVKNSSPMFPGIAEVEVDGSSSSDSETSETASTTASTSTSVVTACGNQ